MKRDQNEISQFYGNKVSYFYGDGLNFRSEELGYEKIKWRCGDKIEITEYDREHGEFKEYYTIIEIESDEEGSIFASVYYSGSSLDD